MSESFTPEAEDTSSEAEFEAARVAEEGEDAGEIEAGAEEAEEAEPKVVDWEKKAHDKEGQAAKERARRRAAESRERALEERLAKLEASSKRPESDDEDIVAMIRALPDGDDDPIGKIEALEKIIRKFGSTAAADAEAEAQARTKNDSISRVVSAMNESEAEFAEDHPDYKDAVKHFKAARQSEFEDMGYSGKALEQAMAEDLLGLASRAIQGGRDPAEVVYNLAKKRGFKAGATEANEKLRAIAKAAEAGGSPKGGTRTENRLTYTNVSNLKGAAFDAAFNKLREQERRAG